MKKLWFALVFILGTLLHYFLIPLNEILKNADSFAYLQMSHFFWDFRSEAFWTGWFGFLYSILIHFWSFFSVDEFLSAQIINLILFNFTGIILYFIWKRYLRSHYLIFFLALFFLSPILLNFNISVLSENLYIPLFLLLFLAILKFYDKPKVSDAIMFWFLLMLLYITRWEAFIYLLAIWLISLIFLLKKYINFSKFILINILLLLSFLFFSFPYILHLNSITWEWWLTNKGSSNLRQAMLRGIDKMDDEWFEQAVWELSKDKLHLKAWFAWWLKYDKLEDNISLKDYISENPSEFFSRWFSNQKKLYFQNMPHIVLWYAVSLYSNENSKFFNNKFLLSFLIIPIIFFFVGIYYLIIDKRNDLLISFFSFFLIASIFFTMFFVLDRYFIIFLPIILIIIVYWIDRLNFNWVFKKRYISKSLDSLSIIKSGIILSILFIYFLWIFSFYNIHKNADEYYSIKKEAWEWLQNNWGSYIKWNVSDFKKWVYDIDILERFPIVTYYSWTKNRWITPYTENIEDIVKYAKFNKIEFLIVDTLDFKKYRPQLHFLLDETKNHNWIIKVKTFKKLYNWENQKVIIYAFR